MFSKWISAIAVPLLVGTALLATPQTAQAQRYRWGGYYYDGYYPGYYYPGYYGYSYGPAWSSYPYSTYYGYPPRNSWGPGYYTPPYIFENPVVRPERVEYQSAYPPAVNSTVTVQVRVPSDAEVWIGQSKMSQTGPERQFVSPPLTPGVNYTYEITALWMKDGREVVGKRTLNFRAGEQNRLSVDFNVPQ